MTITHPTGNKKMSNNVADLIERVEKNDPELTTLKLCDEFLGYQGAIALADALKQNTTLLELHLSRNFITGPGSKPIAEALEKNTTIQDFFLGFNTIGDDGAEAMSKILKANTTLTTMDLSGNNITSIGAKDLSNALRDNTSLRELNLHWNSLGDQGISFIVDSVTDNQTLGTLNLGYNCISDHGVGAIASCVKKNTSIESLALWGNNISNQGAQVIVNALKDNKTITNMSLNDQAESFLHDYIKCNAKILPKHKNGISDYGPSYYISVTEDKKLKWTNNVKNLFMTDGKLTCLLYAVVAAADSIAQAYRDSKEFDGAMFCDKFVEQINHFLVENRSEGASHAITQIFNFECGSWRNWTIYSDPEEDDDETKSTTSCWSVSSRSLLSFRSRSSVDEVRIPDDEETIIRYMSSLIEILSQGGLKQLIESAVFKEQSSMIGSLFAIESTEVLDFSKFLIDRVGSSFDENYYVPTPRTIAMTNNNKEIKNWAFSVGTILNRYKIDEGPPIHQSSTCRVHFASDLKFEREHPLRKVAVKIMKDDVSFSRELKNRLTLESTEEYDGKDMASKTTSCHTSHIIPLLRFHPADRCLVLAKGQRSLAHILDVEMMEDTNVDSIKTMMKDIGIAIQSVHKRGIVHLNIDPTNIIRLDGKYMISDFDSSVENGTEIDRSHPLSTAFVPPEFIRMPLTTGAEKLDDIKNQCAKLEETLSKSSFTDKNFEQTYATWKIVSSKVKNMEEGIGKLKVSPDFDIWSLGVTYYSILTSSPIFKCDTRRNLANEEEINRLSNWSGLSDSGKQKVLAYLNAKDGDVRSAKDLLDRCLNPEPRRRFKSVDEMLKHKFFK